MQEARRHQKRDVRKRATSAAAEIGGVVRNVHRNRNRALAQVILQARRLRVYGSGTLGDVEMERSERRPDRTDRRA